MKTLYLDTSIINRIYDDPDFDKIINIIKSHLEIYPSIFNVIELASTPNMNRRIGLLKILKSISGNYRPLALPGEILKRSLQAICLGDKNIDISIDDKFEDVWEMLNDPERIGDDAYTDIYNWKQKQEKWYQDMHYNGRPMIQKVISSLSSDEQNELYRNFSKLINYYSQQFKLISDFIDKIDIKNILSIPPEEKVNKILKYSEHWRFFLAGLIYSLYTRSFRSINYSKKKNPGSIDTQQSIYLANCDIIVTSDYNQYKMFRLLVKLGDKKRYSWNYITFRNWVIKIK